MGKSLPRDVHLAPDLYLIETTDPWTTALHMTAVSYLDRVGGSAIWIDSLDNAMLFTISKVPPDIPDIWFWQSFTAYQHHEVVRKLPGTIRPDTELIVVPCVTSLYDHHDIQRWEGHTYLQSTLRILLETAEHAAIPILASGVTESALFEHARSFASMIVSVERTGNGYRFEPDEFDTAVQWKSDRSITTLPVWDGPITSYGEPISTEELADLGFLPDTVK